MTVRPLSAKIEQWRRPRRAAGHKSSASLDREHQQDEYKF